MKRVFLLLFMLVSFNCIAQVYNKYTGVNNFGTIHQRIEVAKTLGIPYGIAASLNGGGDHPGAIFYNTVEDRIYVWTGTVWSPVAGSGGANIYNTNGTLTGNRTLNGGMYSLTMNNLSGMQLFGASGSNFTASFGGTLYLEDGVVSLARLNGHLNEVYLGIQGLKLISNNNLKLDFDNSAPANSVLSLDDPATGKVKWTDISGLLTPPDLQTVTTQGASTTNSFGVTHDGYKTISLTGLTHFGSAYMSIDNSNGGELFLGKTNGRGFTLSPANIATTDKLLNAPNANGTLAVSVNGFTANADGEITIPAGGGTVTSIGLTSSDITVGGTSPITTSGTYTLTLPNVNSDIGSYTNANITVNAKGQVTAVANGSAGVGTVTSVSDLAPLFTTSTPTAAATFNLSNAAAYTVFGNQTGSTGAPSYGKLNVNSIDAIGTPGSTNFLRGDGEWVTQPYLDPTFLQITADNLGITQNTSKGLHVRNTIAATAILNQMSPAIMQTGSVYTGGVATQVDTRFQFVPSGQGGYMNFQQKIGVGAWTDIMNVGTSSGGTNYGVGFGGALPGNTGSAPLTVNGSIVAGTYNSTSIAPVQVSGRTILSVTGSNPNIITELGNNSGIATVATSKDLKVGNFLANSSTAILEVVSTTKGSIPVPSMTTAQRTAIVSPATGLQVYDNTLLSSFEYNGSAWVQQLSAGTQTIAGSKTFSSVAYTSSRLNVNGATDNGGYGINLTGNLRSSGSLESVGGIGSFTNAASSLGGIVLGSGPAYNGVAANLLGSFGWLQPATSTTPFRIMQDVATGTGNGTGFQFSYYTSSSPTALNGVTATGNPQVGLLQLNTALNASGNAVNSFDYYGLRMVGAVSDPLTSRPFSYNMLYLSPTFSSGMTAATSRAIYYNPVMTITPSIHRFIEQTRGDNLFNTTSGSTGIGVSTSIEASALLEIKSTVKGVLLPRMTTTEKLAILTPAEGLEVYDLTLHQKSYYNGTTWVNY